MLNVLPCSSHNDASHCGWAHFIFFSQSVKRRLHRVSLGQIFRLSVSFSNFDHRKLIEFGISNLLSSCCSAFKIPVFVILYNCSNPEMTGIATVWIVSVWTIMKHKLVFGNLSMSQLPRDSMCMTTATRIPPKCPVPLFVSISHPLPTIIWTSLVDFFPKSVVKIAFWSGEFIVATSGAATCSVNLRRKLLEFLSANRTFVLGHLKAFLLDVQRLVRASLTFCTPLSLSWQS